MYEYFTYENLIWIVLIILLILLLIELFINKDKFDINKIYEYPNMLSDEQINTIENIF